LLGFIALALTLAPVILIVKGEKIRRRSSFMKEATFSKEEGKDENLAHPHIGDSGLDIIQEKKGNLDTIVTHESFIVLKYRFTASPHTIDVDMECPLIRSDSCW
jgi:hypothetical protein